jgi:uncharacterized protein YaaW (UPF0174 family)
MKNIFLDNTNEDITAKTNFNEKEKAVVLYLFNKQIKEGSKHFQINIKDLSKNTSIEENKLMDFLKDIRRKEVEILDKKRNQEIISGIIASIKAKSDIVKEIEMSETITRYLK